MKRVLIASLLALAACTPTIGGRPVPNPRYIPQSGPIIYSCADGTQLQVTYDTGEARVAVVGGVSMVLPASGGTPEAPTYTNGRYTLNGRGAAATWAVGRAAPTNCRGG